MSFVNTVDVIGDEALTSSIIDRSITEIADNLATSIGNYAFRDCANLTTANFPAATSISNYAFYSCKALTTANFPAATSIGENAFSNCTTLTTANSPVATRISGYAFNGCSALTTANFPVATSIGANAFKSCTTLTTANFPVATSIGSSMFQNCTALTTANFPVATRISGYAFYSCSELTALILRSDTMCTLSGTSAFTNTPIASGTGYIYVPRALVDSYKAASNWSTYANQFRAIEDYPQVCAKDTWEGVQASMAAGTYATDYKVGDTVALDLGSEGVVEMQIAAFDTDDLADGSGKAKITWVSKDLLATARRMNPARSGSSGAYTDGTGGVGGWEKSELRSALKNTVKPLVPDAVQNMIVEVTKSHRSYDTAGTYSTQTTSEDVWIPSADELSYGIYMGLFPDDESRKKYRQDGSLSNWWTRDAASTSSFYFVSSGNTNSSIAAGNNYGVALSFCTN